MPVEGCPGEPLRSLLEFESLQHHVPIRFRKTDLRRGLPPEERFEPILDVIVHTDPHPLPFAVPTETHVLHIRTPVCEEPLPNPTGPTHEGETIPLAYLDGRRIVIPFDLDALENQNGVTNPTNHLWNEIARWALPAAIEAIRTHDWERERSAYVRAKVRALEECVARMDRDVADNDYDIANHTRQVVELARKNDELRITLRLMKQHGRAEKEAEARNEFDDLRRMIPGAYRTIDVTDEYLIAETGEIVIQDRGHAYEMGRYRVEIPLTSDRVTITNRDSRHAVGGYPHPHVDTLGHPCLGNISISLTKLLAMKQYPAALVLIRRFLESYNVDNPYIPLERWDPDHEDDSPSSDFGGTGEEGGADEFDRCYENATLRECVECRNRECPYWEDRFDRCDENSDLATCLECQSCDAWRRRVEICWADADPVTDCMEGCSHDDCPHWRNADDCIETHEGDRCPGCANTDCDRRINLEDPNDSCADRSADA